MSIAPYETFIRDLAKSAPPPGLDPRLAAIWRGLKGEWDAAHAIVQDLDDRDAAWVHAWLHRIEGDLGNAGYWYRRAGRPVAKGGTDDEGRAIAKALIEG